MKLRRARQASRGRIEIIPMIDVMFFLLITFMLASLSLQNLHSLGVSLPKGEAAPLSTAKAPITLTITKSGSILINKTPVKLEGVAAALKPLLKGPDPSIIVNADAAAAHGVVTEAMLRARDAGVEHFLIAVKHEK
jgi:biopolymer transport protein ExbD